MRRLLCQRECHHPHCCERHHEQRFLRLRSLAHLSANLLLGPRSDVSGHVALCYPTPRTADDGRAPAEGGTSRLGTSSAPTECILAGGFEEVTRSSARCHRLRLRDSRGRLGQEAQGTWDEAPAMIDRRHGGFAAALVACGGGSPPPPVLQGGAGAAEGTETEACCDLPTLGSTVMAVAGGLDGPLRTGGRVLGSAEWLCSERERWYPLGSMSHARYGCAGASLLNQLIAIGGSAGRSNLSSVEAIDLRVGTWRELAPLPQALYGCAASSLHVSATERIIVACGGCDESRSAVSATYVYDIRADRWRTTAHNRKSSSLGLDSGSRSLRTARMCHAVVAVPRRCLPTGLWFGASGDGGGGGEGERSASAASSSVDLLEAASEECLLALGGKPPNDALPIHGTVEVFDPHQCEWYSMPWELPTPTWHQSASVVFT